MKPTAKLIAEWIFETSATETGNQSWITYYDDIAKHFGVTKEWVKENHESILECLRENEDVLSINDEDNCFDLIVSGNAVCKRCCITPGAHCDACNIEH